MNVISKMLRVKGTVYVIKVFILNCTTKFFILSIHHPQFHHTKITYHFNTVCFVYISHNLCSVCNVASVLHWQYKVVNKRLIRMCSGVTFCATEFLFLTPAHLVGLKYEPLQPLVKLAVLTDGHLDLRVTGRPGHQQLQGIVDNWRRKWFNRLVIKCLGNKVPDPLFSHGGAWFQQTAINIHEL